VGFRNSPVILTWKPVFVTVFSSNWHYDSAGAMGSISKFVWLKAEKHVVQVQESTARQWFRSL